MNRKIGINQRYVNFIILIILFLYINISNNKTATVVLWIVAMFWFLLSKIDNSYIIYFLIPNINILDVGEIPIPPVNVWIIVLGLKYLFTKPSNKDYSTLYRNIVNLKIDLNALLAGFLVFILELLHFSFYKNLGLLFINSINIAININVFSVIFKRGNEQTWNLYTESFVLGVIVSLFVNLISDPGLIGYIMSTRYRLEAYANDPNYYSMYIVLSMTAIFRKIDKNNGNKMINTLLFILLTIIGLLTSSKMCIICMGFIYIAFIISTFNIMQPRRLKLLISIIPFGIIVFALLKDEIELLFNKVIGRFGLQSSVFNLDTLTSGRSIIVESYINRIKDDFSVLLFGRGLNYNEFFASNGRIINVAHNTYLDLVLSWGVIGTAVFVYLLSAILKRKLVYRNKTVFDYLSMGVFLIMLFALSCLSANMFWYLFVICLIPLKREAVNEGVAT